MRRHHARAALVAVALGSLGACAPSPLLRAARSGDGPALHRAIESERSAGKLDFARMRQLARAVSAREILTAQSASGLSRIDDVRGCAHELRDPLASRAGESDDVAAAATLALLDAGGAGQSDRRVFERFRASPSALWRAAAARASGKADDRARAPFFSDPDERVRLAALRSAIERPRPDEADVLLDAARLDPNPLARALAVRAAGRIGGASIVLALRDLYNTADDEQRSTIVDAWAAPRSVDAGGEREIRAMAESEGGLAAVEAGAALLGMLPGNAASGLAALTRAAENGSTRERIAAILRLPLRAESLGSVGPELDLASARRAVERASSSPDLAVRTTALVRLLDLPASRVKALADLRAVSDKGVRPAILALAKAGDPSAQDALRRDLGARIAEVRLSAARALIGAGRATDAADALADTDAHVRTSVACSVLSQGR